MYDDDFYYDYYESTDWERDTFYALTDGMCGDYEDFRSGGGDFGDLMDSLGF